MNLTKKKIIAPIAVAVIAVTLILWLIMSTPPTSYSRTFGYESKGSQVASVEDCIVGSWFTCPEQGNVESITVYLNASSFHPGDAKCAIYNKSGSLIAVTEEITNIISDGWYTFNFSFSTPPSLETSAKYWLVVWSNCYDGWGYPGVAWDFGASEADRMGLQYQLYDSFPSTFSPGSHIAYYWVSIYCNYTVTAPREINWGLILIIILVSAIITIAVTRPKGK